MKQTKNQITYSFAGQKLAVNSEYIAYQRLFCYLTFQLYKTPSGYCTSFASQVRATTELNVKNRPYLYPPDWWKTHPFALAKVWPTIFLSWPRFGQLSFCLGQGLANYLFVLAKVWPTIFLHWPTSGQLSFYIGQPLACGFLYGNLLRNINIKVHNKYNTLQNPF